MSGAQAAADRGPLPARIETVVIGAGQSGLTMSHYLTAAGREHVVLDRRPAVGGGWQDRWDEFRLVSPNWTLSLPGRPYDGPEPHGYMPRDEIVDRLRGYGASFGVPLALETEVTNLRARSSGGFDLRTMRGPVRAERVILATGGFHRRNIPDLGGALSPRVLALHAADYRREGDLPPGGVLVVGSGQTGVQLTEELRAAGRDVVLAVGTAGRVPRRYRGRDIFHWLWSLAELGPAHDTPLPRVDQLPDPRRRLAANPHLSGHQGGHEVDLRALGRDGVRLVGRLLAVDGERVTVGGDLVRDLDAADRFFDERFGGLIGAFIERSGVAYPAVEPRSAVDFVPLDVRELDLRREGIGTVLFSAGFRPDYGWIDHPVTDELGFLRQERGITELPGLFVLGMLWQLDQGSAALFGMPRDARALARHLGLIDGTAPEPGLGPPPADG